MHRALVIRLGESLEDAVEHLQREYAARDELGTLGDVRVRFLDAPPAAVGNLTNPVQVLRENLEADLVEHLTELLELSAGAADVVLDVFVLVNLGEPLVANATAVVTNLVTGIVADDFRAMFPAHRTGAQRRFRIVPIALLPAARDCKKDRVDAVAELRALHDWFAERREPGKSSVEFPVDRFFLIDAMTGQGIATIGDLVEQVRGFMRLTLFSGIRRQVDFVQLLESECGDLFATFGVATCEVDIAAIRRDLTRRMADDAARVLGESGSPLLADASELLPVAAREDGELRRTVRSDLDGLPLRTLEVEGSAAVGPLRTRYEELAQRVATWREEEASASAVATAPDSSRAATHESSGTIWKLAAALALGTAVCLVAHFALAVSLGLSVGTGGAFAFLALVILIAFLREAPLPAGSSPTAELQEVSARSEHLEEIAAIIDERLSKLRALDGAFRRIATAKALDADGREETAGLEPTQFRQPMTTDSLLELLYARHASAASPRGVADRFLATIGTWNDLLEGKVAADASDLSGFCRDHFRTVARNPMFGDGDSRACVRLSLADFVTTWAAGGIPVFLEGESRKQFDPDGFRVPFRSCLIGPSDLGPALREAIGESPLTLYPGASRLDDVFVVSAVIDIHPQAVSALES